MPTTPAERDTNPEPPEPPPLSDTPLRTALGNVIPNAMSVTSGRVETALSPIDTVRGMYGITAGLISQFVPGEQPSEDYIREAARGLYERYGTLENAQRTFENEPVAMAMELTGMRLLGAPRRLAERVREARRRREDVQRSTLNSAARNFLPSLAGLLKDITAPVHSPIETTRSFAEIGKGVVALLPGEQGSWEESRETVEKIGGYIANRYGTWEGFREAVRTDPAGVLADVGGLALGGSTLALKVGAKAGQLAKAGRLGATAQQASQAVGGARQAADLRRLAVQAAREAKLKPASVTSQREARSAQLAADRASADVSPAAEAGRYGTAAAKGFTQAVGGIGRRIDPTNLATRGLTAAAGGLARGAGQSASGAMAAGTGSPMESFATAYRTSRENLVGDGSRRAQPGEVGGKQALRDLMYRRVPADTVVNDVREGVSRQRNDQSRRFTEALDSSTASGPLIEKELPFSLESEAVGRLGVAARAVKSSRGMPGSAAEAVQRGVDSYLDKVKQIQAAGENSAAKARLEGQPAAAVRAFIDTAKTEIAALRPSTFVSKSLAETRMGPRGRRRAQEVFQRAYGPDGGHASLRPSTFTSDATENRQRRARDKEFAAARSQWLRANPELSNELSADIAGRRAGVARSEAAKKGSAARVEKSRRDQLAMRVEEALGLGARGQPPSPSTRKIIDAAIKSKERGGAIIDYAIKHGRLTADELRDLWAVKKVLRPGTGARLRSTPAVLKAAGGVVGSLARPIARVGAQAFGGAVLGGSRLAQKGALRQLGRGFTTIPRAVISGTRAGWRGRQGAKAGAAIGATQAGVKPVPFTTGVRAAADIGRRLRSGEGPIVSRRTRQQLVKDLQKAKRSVVEGSAGAGVGAVRSYMRAGLSEGQKRSLEAMRSRLSAEMDRGVGARGEAPAATVRPEADDLRKLANQPIDLERAALAVDEAVNKTFEGLDLDPATVKVRADVGRWMNDFLRQGKKYKNVAGADALLQRLDNALGSASNIETGSRSRRVLQAAREALRGSIMEQAPPAFRRNLEAREAAQRHLTDAEKSLSASSGQGAEVALRKLIDASKAHDGSSADARLRRQYMESLNVPHLDEKLAGLSLDSPWPTSVNRQGVGGVLAAASLVDPTMLSLALMTSPRAMGTLASAAGGVAGSRPARALKSLYRPGVPAKATRAAGLVEGMTEDDQRSALRLLAALVGGGARMGYGAAGGLAALLGGGWRGADAVTSAAFDRPSQ